MDKEKVKKRLLRSCKTERCLICNKGISQQDIINDNFEQIDKKYIHSSCFNNHIPRLD